MGKLRQSSEGQASPGSLRRAVVMACVAVTAWMPIVEARAMQVLPKVSDVDRKLTRYGANSWLDSIGQWVMGNAIPMIKAPVHEAITLAALGCQAEPGAEETCVTLEAINANRVVLYGVRWPDDPPFRLNANSPPRIRGCDAKVTMRSTAQPACWYALFEDAKAKASVAFAKDPSKPAFGPGDYLLYRSHFGDLQFMHSMGTQDGEAAEVTQARMRMWAKFLWGVAMKQIPTDKYIRELGIAGMEQYFPGDMTATNLFATGIVEVRRDLDKVAIGALLHMVQDSFSQAHTERDQESGAACPSGVAKPGRIQQFYSYARQEGSSHDAEDTFAALANHTLQTSPSVIDVSREFIALWQRQASWDEAEKLFNCVFELAPGAPPAGPGRFEMSAK